MSTTIAQPQTNHAANEDLRRIEDRVDQLSELLEPEAGLVMAGDAVDALKLGNYRLDIAKVIDQVMAETDVWWIPERDQPSPFEAIA